MAKAEQCTVNRGISASCRTENKWCLDTADSVFLGCRPFVVCKEEEVMVCRAMDGEIQSYWVERCIPPGFGRCSPPLPADASGPPAACAG